MATAETLFDQALSLPLVKRKQLVGLLIESIPEDDEELATVDDELEAALERRIEEIRTGRAKLVDMETAMSRIRAAAQPHSAS